MKHPINALDTLRSKRGSFDLVITDVHLPYMSGFELQKLIDQEFQLPVVFMSAEDNDSVIIKGLQSGASFFIVKPVTRDDLKHVWQYAFANKKGKALIEKIETAHPLTSIPGTNSTTANDILNKQNECKRKAIMKETRDSYAIQNRAKKFCWNDSHRNKFLDAIKSLGLDRATPMGILEFMNVPGLTRDNVASHLQMYRNNLKKEAETHCKILNDQIQSASAKEQPSEFLSKKHSDDGNQNNSKRPMLGVSKSYHDANIFTYNNILNLPLTGKLSKGVVISQGKPQTAQKDANNALNIDTSGFEKIGAFNLDPNGKGLSKGVVISQGRPQMAQKGTSNALNLDPNGKELAKLIPNENNGLGGSSNFVSGNEWMNPMRYGSMSKSPCYRGTYNPLTIMGGSSSSKKDQPTFQVTPGLLDGSYSGNKSFSQLLSDQGGASFTGTNQTIIQSQTQVVSRHQSNYGLLDGSYSGNNPQQFSDQGGASFTGTNQTIIQSQTQVVSRHQSNYGLLDGFYFGNNPQQFSDQGGASFTGTNQTIIQSQTQQSGSGEELLPSFGMVGSSLQDPLLQSSNQQPFQSEEDEFVRSLLIEGNDTGDDHPGTS